MFRITSSTRYVPQDAQAIQQPGGVVYLYGALCAIAYRGKRNQPEWNYSFKSEERRQQAVQEFFESLERSAAFKAQRKAERRQPHVLKVGDVVYNSWGYEQTNVDFYEIVKVTAHFVWLQQLSRRIEETAFMQGTAAAIPGSTGGPATRHRVYGAAVNFEHGSGAVWNGTPRFCSWYA